MIGIAKKQVWAGSGGLILILLAGVLGVNAWRKVPSYDGRSLNYWLECLPVTIDPMQSGEYFTKHIHYSDRRARQAGSNSMGQGATTEQAAEQEAYGAIKALGKKCLSVLLLRLQEVDSPAKLKLRSWAAKAHVPPALIGDSAGIRRGQAVTALLKLNYRARSVTPELIGLTNHPN